MTIANMAEAYTLPVIIHNPYGPIYDAICTHLAAATPNLLAVEYPKYYYTTEPKDLRTKIVKEPIECKNSQIKPPTKPGLGIELDEETLKKYSKTIE